MARVVLNPIGLHKFRPYSFVTHQSLQLIKPSVRSLNRTRRCQIIFCQTNPNPADSSETNQTLTTREAREREKEEWRRRKKKRGRRRWLRWPNGKT
ncbi:hypothetical protein CsSME_00003844 [Camellia sinensis var. sinensis]